jgi:hypothetical protein
MMGLMTEVKERMCSETINIPTIKCTMFEDNEGAIALAKLQNEAHQCEDASVQKARWENSIDRTNQHIGSTGRYRNKAISGGPIQEAAILDHGLVTDFCGTRLWTPTTYPNQGVWEYRDCTVCTFWR